MLGICYTCEALCCNAHGCCAVECGVACCASQHTSIATLTQTTESMKAEATSLALVEDNKGTRWTIFKKWSTTAKILVLPPFSRKFIRKSIAKSGHGILMAGIS